MPPKFEPQDTRRARELRRDMTPAERKLWRALSSRQVDGHHFTKQYPIGPYFADFACRRAGLVVEVDGDSHAARVAADARRDGFLADRGFRTLRVTNEDVHLRLEGVLQVIAAALADRPSPDPSRKREGR